MYLVDTNIWLERLLDQDRSEEVGDFLQRVSNDRLFLTDFTLHSIGIILLKLGEAQTFSRFVQDVLIDGAVRLVGLQPDDMTSIVDAAGKYQLDFDDAYQYAASGKFNFQIVSFDTVAKRHRNKNRRTFPPIRIPLLLASSTPRNRQVSITQLD